MVAVEMVVVPDYRRRGEAFVSLLSLADAYGFAAGREARGLDEPPPTFAELLRR